MDPKLNRTRPMLITEGFEYMPGTVGPETYESGGLNAAQTWFIAAGLDEGAEQTRLQNRRRNREREKMAS